MADMGNTGNSGNTNVGGVTSTKGYDPQAQAPVGGAPKTDKVDDTMALRKQLNTIVLTPEELAEWWTAIDAAEKRTKAQSEKWDTLLKEYLPVIKPGGTGEEVKVNIHFRNVHTKMGQLFVKSPTVQFVPEGPCLDQILIPDPTTGMPRPMSAEEVVSVKQHVVNKKLGRDCINIQNVMDECEFDIMAWAGIACVKVGYIVVMKTIQKPVMVPDPTYVAPPAPPSILGLAPQAPAPMVPQMNPATGAPVTQPQQVPIYCEWYAKRFSPKKFLANADLSSSNFDKEATFTGMKFFMGKRQAMRQFGITEDELQGGSQDKDIANYDDDQKDKPNDLVEGYEVAYKASLYTDEVDPQVINHLVLIKGIKGRTIVSRMSPDQTIDPGTGKLTPDSLLGFPYKVGSNRTMADTPFVIADSGFTNSSAKYLDTHRRQGVKLRDAQIGKYLVDAGAFEDDDIESMKNGSVGDFVFVTGGSMMNGSDKIFAQTGRIQGSQDDYRMATLVKADIDETLGIGSTQAGAPTEGVRSATEVSQFQNASTGRIEKEQSRFLDFFLDIVRAVDTLITRYASGENYIMIEGEDGARRIAMWNRKLLMAGVYGYEIKVDSQLKNDVAKDRQQKMSFYNLAAQDPLFNRIPVLRDLSRDFGYDPSKTVIDPAVAALGGGNPPHGGPVSKHESENSGGKPNAPGASNRTERNPQPGAQVGTPNK